MEIAERLGDEVLWAGAAQAFAWHKIVSGELAEGLSTLERAFEVADRQQRPFLAWMGSNIRGQLTLGPRRPRRGAAVLRGAAAPAVRRQDRATGRRSPTGSAAVTSRAVRSTRRARRCPTRAAAWITHSLKPLLDLWDGRWEEVDVARDAGARDESPQRQPLGRVGLLSPVGAGAQPARRARSRRRAARTGRWRSSSPAARATGRCGRGRTWRACAPRPGGWRRRASTSSAAGRSPAAARTGAAERAMRSWRRPSCSAREPHGRGRSPLRRGAGHLRRQRLRDDEAEALHQWGRALARAGDARGAARSSTARWSSTSATAPAGRGASASRPTGGCWSGACTDRRGADDAPPTPV